MRESCQLNQYYFPLCLLKWSVRPDDNGSAIGMVWYGIQLQRQWPLIGAGQSNDRGLREHRAPRSMIDNEERDVGGICVGVPMICSEVVTSFSLP